MTLLRQYIANITAKTDLKYWRPQRWREISLSLAIVTLGVPVAVWSHAAPIDDKALMTFAARVDAIEGPVFAGQSPKSVTIVARGHRTLSSAIRSSGSSAWIDLSELDQDLRALKPDGPPYRILLTFQGLFPANWASATTGGPLKVQAQITGSNHEAWPLRGVLFGPDLGVVFWRDQAGKLHAATMADYDRRYWTKSDAPGGAASDGPKHFLIVDRFIGGDDDYGDWRDGVTALHDAGVNTFIAPAIRAVHETLLKQGVTHIGWAVVAPGKNYIQIGDPTALSTWARGEAARYQAAGFRSDEMSIYAIADEPGWYYPEMFGTVRSDPAVLDRFREYLRAQGLTPRDAGAASWSEIFPLGRSAVHDLASRRLFYWSMRFFPADSGRYFASATQALETSFTPGPLTFIDWNNFSGRLYAPGPVAHNRDVLDPDAAMGMEDWFEFGRERASSLLWTEDWFNDQRARQWSYYAARLASAVREQQAPGSPERFGGYIVPRVSSAETPDGLTQKAMALIGHGGKVVQYYWFGPDYNFPGNCYSDVPGALAAVRRANKMIAAGENLLWPGQPLRSPVAILFPRSAEIWDAQDQRLPTAIQDATNINLNNGSTDYMAEVADLFTALQDADIPVEFVSEDSLTAEGLRPYRVLYVTEPDVPAEAQIAIAGWTRAGGTLATVANAATDDRYDRPFTTLQPLTAPPPAPARW